MSQPTRIILSADRTPSGTTDLTNVLKTIEGVLNRHDLGIVRLVPTVRVLSTNGVWLSTDRVIIMDTAVGNLTLDLPTPQEMLATGFVRLVVKKLGGNTVLINPPSGVTIDGGAGYVLAGAGSDAVEIVPSISPGAFGYYTINTN